jgi:hypothetical protein
MLYRFKQGVQKNLLHLLLRLLLNTALFNSL